MIECVIYIFLYIWPTVVKDIAVTLGYVNIIWDTSGEEVTLEFIHKEKDEKVTKDYYKLKLNMSIM